MAAWSLRVSLGVLGVATVVTALISEILVHSIDAFAADVGLAEFFVAAVIVAIVGNAAEHGGAVVVAARGKMKLATRDRDLLERAGRGLPDPGGRAALWLIDPLALASGRSRSRAWLAVLTAPCSDGHSCRGEGFLDRRAYVGAAAGFWVAGDR